MSASDDMELYDLRVTVDSIAGRPVCGLAVGDYFEVTESSLLPAKQRQLPHPTGSSRTAWSPTSAWPAAP